MTQLIETHRIVIIALVGPAHLEVHERARRQAQRGAHLAALQRLVAEILTMLVLLQVMFGQNKLKGHTS